MEKPNIAILGASGIGKFHAREFHNAGCNISAILGSTQESAAKTSTILKYQFNISANSYSDLETLLKHEKIDAVSICTPQNLHAEQVRTCLSNDLHVLCEKPFVRTPDNKNYELAKELVNFAIRNKKILSINTQWPSIIPHINPSPLSSFSVYMEPGCKGLDMLYDHLPHANSLLVNLIPQGIPSSITFPIKTPEEIKILFNYETPSKKCNASYHFKFKGDRPRAVKFSFNGEEFSREIGENYQQALVSPARRIQIEDPLKMSINKFVSAIKAQGDPLVSYQEILDNVSLQDQIIGEYLRN